MSDEGSPSSSVHSRPSTIFILPSRIRPSPVTDVLKIVLNILDVVVVVLEDVGSEVVVVDGDVTKRDVMGTVDGGVVEGTTVEAGFGIETMVEAIVVGGCVVGAKVSVEGTVVEGCVVDLGGCVGGMVVGGCVVDMASCTVVGSCVVDMGNCTVVGSCVVDMGNCVEGMVVAGCVEGTVVVTTLVVFTLGTVVARTVVDVVGTVLAMGDVDVYLVDVGSPGLTPPTDSTVTTPITSSTTVKSGNSVVEDMASTPVDVSLVYVVASTSLGVTKVTLSGIADVTCAILGPVVTMSISGMSVDTFAEADISLKSGF